VTGPPSSDRITSPAGWNSSCVSATSSPSSSGASASNGGRSARKRAISLSRGSKLPVPIGRPPPQLCQQPEALAPLYGLGAVAHPELAVHRAGVFLDGVLGEVQLLCDLRVGCAGGHQRQHR